MVYSVAFGVMGLKYLAYALTGSVALYSDALESIVNVIAAIGAWWAIRVSYLPADDNHPSVITKPSIFRLLWKAF